VSRGLRRRHGHGSQRDLGAWSTCRPAWPRRF